MSVEDSPDSHRLLAARRQKLEALRAAGVAPFGDRFDTDGSVGDIRARFAEGAAFRMAGRITAHRDMGKSHFLDLSDLTGRLQIYVSLKTLTPEQAAVFGALDIGDFLGVEGEGFVTKTGEPTLRVSRFVPLGKALRPLPDKYHGLVDVEARHRQRYLDLLANEKSRETFLARSQGASMASARFSMTRGFLEVETPMMQPVAGRSGGGAVQDAASRRSASTCICASRRSFYLKRLLVGGFPKVFELNRNFRNEGIVSRRHNPEFTMLEAYWAYADFELMAESDGGTHLRLGRSAEQIEHRDAEGSVTRTINLARPWRRARYRDLIEEASMPGWFALTPARTAGARRRNAGLRSVRPGHGGLRGDAAAFREGDRSRITFDPLFVTHLPKELVPLAKAECRRMIRWWTCSSW